MCLYNKCIVPNNKFCKKIEKLNYLKVHTISKGAYQTNKYITTMISTNNWEPAKNTFHCTTYGNFGFMIYVSDNPSDKEVKNAIIFERLKQSIDKLANSLNDMYTCGVNTMHTQKINESMIRECEIALGRVTIALKEYKHKHTTETNIDSKIELYKFIVEEYKCALEAIITTLKNEGFEFFPNGQVLLNGHLFVQEKEKCPRRDYNIFAINYEELI